MDYVLVISVSNQSGNDSLCVAPLTPSFLDTLDHLLEQHQAIARLVPDLVQFRINKTHGLRLVHDGPLYQELADAVEQEPSGIMIRALPHTQLSKVNDLSTHGLDLVVYQDGVALTAHVKHDEADYQSPSLNPDELRKLLRETQ